MKITVNTTKFLDTKNDIKHKDIITFLDEGNWEESTKFKKEDGTPSNSFKIKIELSNMGARTATLNWTNLKLLVSAWGDDTKEWIGKTARAWKTKSEKAKAGFTFYFVPVDWDRDDTGEWIIPANYKNAKKEQEDEIKDIPESEEEEYPLSEGEIPF